MPSFKITFDDFASGVTDAYKTAAAVVANDDDKARFRIRSIDVGPSDDVPPDANLSVILNRIADLSAGTVGVSTGITAANLQRSNVNSQDPLATGETDYSTEPTTFETDPVWQMDINAHAGLPKFFDKKTAPVINRDQLIGIRVASRTGTAIKCSGTIEFEPI